MGRCKLPLWFGHSLAEIWPLKRERDCVMIIDSRWHLQMFAHTHTYAHTHTHTHTHTHARTHAHTHTNSITYKLTNIHTDMYFRSSLRLLLARAPLLSSPIPSRCEMKPRCDLRNTTHPRTHPISKLPLPLAPFLTLHLQYGTLYLLTYVTLHRFNHSLLNSKPTFSHLNSFLHPY